MLTRLHAVGSSDELDGSDKSIASAGDGFDAIFADLFAESFAQERDVDRQVGFLDEGVGPDTAHKVFFFNQLPMAFEQNGQNVDGFAGERHEFVIAKKEALRNIQLKRSELPPDIFWSVHRSVHADLELIKSCFRTFTVTSRFHRREVKPSGELGTMDGTSGESLAQPNS